MIPVAQVLEMFMLILFGLSWPFSIIKSIKSRSAKGKSIPYEILVVLGYLCGISGKFIGNNVTYVVIFYLIDIVMVCIDLSLTIRNRFLDIQADKNSLSH